MNINLFLASVFFMMGWGGAHEDLPCLRQHLGAHDATIGDRIEFIVEVMSDGEQTVLVPENQPMLGNFAVKQRNLRTRQKREVYITTLEYELVSYDVGWDTIPGIEIGILKGNDTLIVSTEGEPIEIKSVAPGLTGQEDIRDLKPQVAMRMPAWQYLLIVISAGVIVAGVLLLVWRRRQGLVAEQPARPAWETALEALSQLSRREFKSPEQIKEFYTDLSRILRAYYEGRFLFPAVEHTTTEIMQRLKTIQEVKPYRDETGDFLRKSDLVKFAKYNPGSINTEREIGLIQEIVESTREKEEIEEGTSA
jgi:hypothetical protein